MEEQFSNEYLDGYLNNIYRRRNGKNAIDDIRSDLELWKDPIHHELFKYTSLFGISERDIPKIVKAKINAHTQALNRAKLLYYNRQMELMREIIKDAQPLSKTQYDSDDITEMEQLMEKRESWVNTQQEHVVFLNDYIPPMFHSEFKKMKLTSIDARLKQYAPRNSFEEQPSKKYKEVQINVDPDRIAEDVVDVAEFEQIPIRLAQSLSELEIPAQRERERLQAEAEQRAREEDERRVLNQQRAQYIADMDARQQQLESGICVLF